MPSAAPQTSLACGLPLAVLARWLLAASCLYLGFPLLVFFAAWLKWWVAVPAVAAVVAASAGVLLLEGRRPPGAPDAPGGPAMQWHQLALLVLLALAFSSLSGMGGYGLQEGDYFKHNAVLKALIQKPWPVYVQSDRGLFPLVYYTAWYLPAALVGKAAGWSAAHHFLFAWSVAGVVLSMLWFCVVAGRVHLLVILVFLIFSGPDVVGAAAMKLLGYRYGPPPPPPVPDQLGIDWHGWRWWNWENRWWAGPYTWNYCSNMELLFWVPQQALGSWIATGMALLAFSRGDGRARRWSLVPPALVSLWSPLVTVGLLPFVAVDLLDSIRRFGRGALRAWAAWPNVLACCVLGLLALYFAARGGPLPFTTDPTAELRFFGFDDWPLAEYLWRLGLFLLLDVGVLVLAIVYVRPPAGPRCRLLLATAVLSLVLLALFRYGMNNDLGMRVSMPGLLVLAVFLAKAALDAKAARLRKAALFGLLAIAATNPVAEVYRHLCEMRRRHEWLAIPEQAEVRTLWELSCETRDRQTGNDFFFRQYAGSPDTPFFRWLARRPAGGAPDRGGRRSTRDPQDASSRGSRTSRAGPVDPDVAGAEGRAVSARRGTPQAA